MFRHAVTRFQRPTLLALLLLLPLVPSGCAKPTESTAATAAEPRVVVTQAGVRSQSVQRSIEVVGNLFGEEESVVSAKVSGRVALVLHDVGDPVAPLAPLAHLDTTDYRLSVEQRKAVLAATLAEIGLASIPSSEFDPNMVPTVVRSKVELVNAEAKHQRVKAMFDEKPPLISEQDFTDNLSALNVARSNLSIAVLSARALFAQAKTRALELAQAEQALSDTTLRAPGGASRASTEALTFVVGKRWVSVGEYVREGTPMFLCIDPDPIKFRAEVPERHMADVRSGQDVDVSVSAYASPFAGKITRISPRSSIESRTFEVEVQIENGKGLLRAGGFARGNIKTRTQEQVVFVPQESVVTFVGITKVFVLREGKAREVRVTTGIQDGAFVEVISTEITPKDQVAVTGVSRLTDGIAVEVKSPESLTGPAIDASRKSSSLSPTSRPVQGGQSGNNK